MPIFWRYLVKSYLKVLSLAVGSFIAVLLVARFKEIARFAALSYDLGKTGLFTVYQVPLILPIAIPISALIASFLLFQRLSRSHELTAFRAAGLRLRSLLAPLLISAGFLALLNFSVTASLCPTCRRETRDMLHSETSDNPLLLLQRQKLVRLKNTYLQLQTIEEGKHARDFLFISPVGTHGGLNLLSAVSLEVEGNQFIGKDVALLSHLPGKAGEFAPLILENQGEVLTEAPNLSAFLKKRRPSIDAPALNFRLLSIRAQEPGKVGRAAKVDLFRRLNLSLAAFTFTFVGASFGIEMSRIQSKKGLAFSLLLALLILLGYTLGKACKHYIELARLISFGPHVLAWIACSFHLRRINRGQI